MPSLWIWGVRPVARSSNAGADSDRAGRVGLGRGVIGEDAAGLVGGEFDDDDRAAAAGAPESVMNAVWLRVSMRTSLR